MEESRLENILMGDVSALGSELSLRTGVKQTLNDRFTKLNRIYETKSINTIEKC
jgi:hypothetical protein